mmetsp:Transcript_70314/g.159031  ORF Transcript_70314/g.159031 Transcript_70314/m.159031 type:complete len:563 (-) Transcript_70314:301-1989(-)
MAREAPLPSLGCCLGGGPAPARYTHPRRVGGLEGEALVLAIVPLEGLEALGGDAAGARGELEEQRPLRLVQLVLHRVPEPLAHRVKLLHAAGRPSAGLGVVARVGLLRLAVAVPRKVAVVVRVPPPVLHVHRLGAAEQELELGVVEDGDQVGRDHRVEALEEPGERGGHPRAEVPLAQEPHVLEPVRRRDRNRGAAGDQLVHHHRHRRFRRRQLALLATAFTAALTWVAEALELDAAPAPAAAAARAAAERGEPILLARGPPLGLVVHGVKRGGGGGDREVEVQCVHHLGGLVEEPLEVPVELRVEGGQVGAQQEGGLQQVLEEGRREEGRERLPLEEGLAQQPPRELHLLQRSLARPEAHRARARDRAAPLKLAAARGVDPVARRARGEQKEPCLGRQQGLGREGEELALEAAHVHARLPRKADSHPLPHLARRGGPQELLHRGLEQVGPVHQQRDVPPGPRDLDSVELGLEPEVLLPEGCHGHQQELLDGVLVQQVSKGRALLALPKQFAAALLEAPLLVQVVLVAALFGLGWRGSARLERRRAACLPPPRRRRRRRRRG